MTISTEDLLDDAARVVAADLYPERCRTVIANLAAELITARAKIEAAQGALENIIHMGHDCPATFAGDEADWQAVRARLMQSYAKAVLAAWESLK